VGLKPTRNGGGGLSLVRRDLSGWLSVEEASFKVDVTPTWRGEE